MVKENVGKQKVLRFIQIYCNIYLKETLKALGMEIFSILAFKLFHCIFIVLIYSYYVSITKHPFGHPFL